MPNNIEGSETTEEVITTPDQAIEAGEKGPSEEKETPAASSAEEKPADEPEVESEEQSSEEEAGDEPEKSEEVDTEDEPEGDKGDKSNDLSDGGEKPKKPKPVEGETPREYALRMEVERVKKANRILRGAKLLGDVQPQKATQSVEYSDEEKKILESFDPEQVSNQEKLFGILAKKNGYVRKDELSQSSYKETAQTVLDDWMEKHTEYSEDKDPDGILWKRFGEEFSMYKAPANPKDHVKIFNRIHNDIFGITTKEKAVKDLKTAAAQQEKVNTASAGAGGSAPRKLSDRRQASPADQELAQVARSGALKGFTEKELKDMGL